MLACCYRCIVSEWKRQHGLPNIIYRPTSKSTTNKSSHWTLSAIRPTFLHLLVAQLLNAGWRMENLLHLPGENHLPDHHSQCYRLDPHIFHPMNGSRNLGVLVSACITLLLEWISCFHSQTLFTCIQTIWKRMMCTEESRHDAHYGQGIRTT